jgi:hypothetical protein
MRRRAPARARLPPPFRPGIVVGSGTRGPALALLTSAGEGSPGSPAAPGADLPACVTYVGLS